MRFSTLQWTKNNQDYKCCPALGQLGSTGDEPVLGVRGKALVLSSQGKQQVPALPALVTTLQSQKL